MSEGEDSLIDANSHLHYYEDVYLTQMFLPVIIGKAHGFDVGELPPHPEHGVQWRVK